MIWVNGWWKTSITTLLKYFNAELLFTDTDSFTYEIKSEDIYEELFKSKHLFDLSNYSKDSKFFDPVNEKVIGKMKDVSQRKINDEFVGLKLLMHSMKNTDGKESNTAKRVNTGAELNELKDSLFNKKVVIHKMRKFKAKKHKVGTYEVNKISLLCFDDKRNVLDDAIHTLAFFDKDLKK